MANTVRRNYQQTICTVSRTDMDALMFDRLDLMVYNEFDTNNHIGENEIRRLKTRLASSEFVRGIEYTDEQINRFINIWNNAPKRPLAPYEHTYMGHILADAVRTVCTGTPPLRCPDKPRNIFYEITPPICEALINYLDNINKENNFAKNEADYNNSMAMELFDMDEVFGEHTEIAMVPEIIRLLKRIQKYDFTKKMSYIYIS